MQAADPGMSFSAALAVLCAFGMYLLLRKDAVLLLDVLDELSQALAEEGRDRP
ncbi:hypothetical protein [Streptomyces sp. NPDC056527]|uniref:hypothetical protein n=1 Tax=Streptomyces sp. NPDC056527 TaxID=3345853 RepID=UPI0036BA2A02